MDNMEKNQSGEVITATEDTAGVEEQQQEEAGDKHHDIVAISKKAILCIVLGIMIVRTLSAWMDYWQYEKFLESRRISVEVLSFELVEVKNESREEALNSFIQAVEEQDGDVLYSLMFYTHIADQEEGLSLLSSENLIFCLSQAYLVETNSPRSNLRYLQYNIPSYGKALPSRTRVYQGEGQNMLYQLYFRKAEGAGQVASMYVEVLPGLDDGWYVKILDGPATDRFGHAYLPFDAAQYGQAFLDQVDDEELQALFVNAYLSQQGPENTLKVGFNSKAQLNKTGSGMLLWRFDDVSITNSGEITLAEDIVPDRGLSVEGMRIRDKELLENGSVRVWMEYLEPGHDGAPNGEILEEGGQTFVSDEDIDDRSEDVVDNLTGDVDDVNVTLIHELTFSVSEDHLAFISYYIYPEGAGEGRQLLTRYLAADLAYASVHYDDDKSYRISKPLRGWELVGHLAQLDIGDRMSPAEEEKLDWARVRTVFAISMECNDRAWLDITIFDDGSELFVMMSTYLYEYLPYVGGGSTVINGAPFGDVFLDEEDTLYRVDQEHIQWFLANMEEFRAFLDKTSN